MIHCWEMQEAQIYERWRYGAMKKEVSVKIHNVRLFVVLGDQVMNKNILKYLDIASTEMGIVTGEKTKYLLLLVS